MPQTKALHASNEVLRALVEIPCALQHQGAAWRERQGAMQQPWTRMGAFGCGGAMGAASWAWAASRSLSTRLASLAACACPAQGSREQPRH